MISAKQIASLAGSLGTLEGLAEVGSTMESLRLHLADGKVKFSRDELAQMLRALDSLSGAILSMDRVTRQMLGRAGSGAIDYVG
jgi:hypothetical protein